MTAPDPTPTPLAAEEPRDDGDDSDDELECDYGEECGRWWGGKLGRSCTKAGSEECDFECPYRSSLYG